jgi:hypothetical protein
MKNMFGPKKEKSAPDVYNDPFRSNPLYAVIRIRKTTAMLTSLNDVNSSESVQGLFRSQARAEEFREHCRAEASKKAIVDENWVIRVLATDLFG